MSQPLYFLPGVYRQQLVSNGELSRAILNERGIGESFADVRANEFYACDIEGGPGGKSGLILAYQTPAGKLPQHTKHIARLQTWSESYDGKVWIGVETENPPRAEDLVRHRVHSGYTHSMGGSDWTIPVIRRTDDTTNLPTDMFWDKSGTVVQPIKRAYQKYWDDSAIVAKWLLTETGFYESYELSKGLLLAVQAVGLNYRYGTLEHNALRLVDTESHMTILAYTVDVPKALAIEQAQKKTSSSPSSQSSMPGQQADSQDTAPAEESYTSSPVDAECEHSTPLT